MTDGYSVQLQDFDGPLDLLLHLIETQKIPIAEVKIASITDQYMVYLKDSLAQQMEVASEFIVMAATLIAIKAKSLLPRPSIQDEDEDDEALWSEDAETLLKERLLEYRSYKEFTLELKQREGTRQNQVARMPISLDLYRERPIVADYLAGLSMKRLSMLFDLAVSRLINEPDVEIYRDLESIPMRMERIEKMLFRGPTTFTKLLDTKKRREWVTVFMALLELVHLKKVTFRQEEVFSEIWIEKA